MTELKDPPTESLVGAEVIRHDAVEKIAGRTRYAGDFHLPRMLHAVIKRSDLPHALLRSVDISAAQRIDGVVGIYLAADVPENTLWMPVPGQTEKSGSTIARANVLADDVVRYHGEPIAVVAAETVDAANAARDAILVDYEPLPVVFDPEGALAEGSAVIHETGNLLASWELEEGNVAAALAGEAVRCDSEYRTQFVDHAYLETESGVAWLDTDEVITIRASTQVVEHYRTLARILGRADNEVRLIAPFIGGGFGGKEDLTVEPYLGLVVHHTGRPVRCVWSRQESLIARPNRHAVQMRYTTAADESGRLVVQDIEILLDGGAYAYLSAPVLLWSTLAAAGPYRCPNVRIRSRVVYTNHTPCSAMRGFGMQQVTFAYEGQMEALAEKLGIDPLELRRRNFVERGDTLPVGQPLDTHVALPELTHAVAERMGPEPLPSGPSKVVGRGFACNLQSYGFNVWMNDAASAWVGIEMDGSVLIRIGVPDVGAGQASSLIQIAAEVLGTAPEHCKIHIADSALTPLAGRTSSTRQLYMSGNAVKAACETLRGRLASLAAEKLGCDPDEIVLEDNRAHLAGVPEPGVPVAALVRAAGAARVSLQEMTTFRAPAGIGWKAEPGWRGRVVPDFTYGCHGVDVEVDRDTGQVAVLRYVAAHDVGRAINPQSVRGQIEGGVVMGLGQALSERVVFDEAQNVTGLFAQYLIPTAVEAPMVESIVLESGEGFGPYNARGIGEPPVSPPCPAVAAALHSATGGSFRETPFTPEMVVQAFAGW